VVIVKDEIIVKVLTAILAKGHILIEDIPGVGKTTLALAFSKALDLEYHRMQFTPDVLPSDVVGFHIYDQKGQEPSFKKGSIFCNMFLADEINRTSSKTQSALLEVMEEGSVTVDAITFTMPKPFIVIATQNPIGSVGTQMLPESQLDRFMVRLSMGYPDIQSEVAILKGRNQSDPLSLVQRVLSIEELTQMQMVTEQIFVHEAIYQYIATLVLRTREHELIALGVSPRGTLALTSMSKAYALLCGRTYVIPDDVKAIFKEVTMHRMVLKPKARVNNVTMDMIIEQILLNVMAPRLVVKQS
jgi:MoxR-like ATPase